jgi:FixJ family two-component response regulator
MTLRTGLPKEAIRLAVVDDDDDVRRALTRLLGTAGFHVSTFASAEEYLVSATPADVDCLVIDVYLGGMNGLELYAALAAAGPVPPTVFVTAHDDAVGAARLSRSDVTCLRKPVEVDTLFEAIADALGSRRDSEPAFGRGDPR